MVIANPPLAEPVIDPGGVTIKPPFEMGVANLTKIFAKSLPFDFCNEVCQNCDIHKLSPNKRMTSATSFID